MLKCPVSGKIIKDAKYAGSRITVDGVRYYFCSRDCKDELLHNSEKYVLNEEFAEIVPGHQNFISRFFRKSTTFNNLKEN